MGEVYFENKILATNLMRFKKKHNLTYQKIGEALGVDKSYVHRIIMMETHPSLPVILRIAKFMNIPVYQLFTPPDDLIQKEFVDKVFEVMEQNKINISELAERSDIPFLRLTDILQCNVRAHDAEIEKIAQPLNISTNFMVNKLLLIENLLNGIEINESQKENIVEYLKNILN